MLFDPDYKDTAKEGEKHSFFTARKVNSLYNTQKSKDEKAFDEIGFFVLVVLPFFSLTAAFS